MLVNKTLEHIWETTLDQCRFGPHDYGLKKFLKETLPTEMVVRGESLFLCYVSGPYEGFSGTLHYTRYEARLSFRYPPHLLITLDTALPVKCDMNLWLDRVNSRWCPISGVLCPKVLATFLEIYRVTAPSPIITIDMLFS